MVTVLFTCTLAPNLSKLRCRLQVYCGVPVSKMSGEKSLQFHNSILLNRCRICSRKFAEKPFLCADFGELLGECFEIDISTDESGVHPTHFCNNCKRITTSIVKAKETGKQYSHRVQSTTWKKHTRVGKCSVCETLCKSGQKRKRACP